MMTINTDGFLRGIGAEIYAPWPRPALVVNALEASRGARISPFTILASSRNRCQWPPRQTLREERALPWWVVGPVDRS